MFRPIFPRLLAAAALVGFVSGVIAGRNRSTASSTAAPSQGEGAPSPHVPSNQTHSGTAFPTIASGSDLTAACQLRNPLRSEAALLTFVDSLDEAGIPSAIEVARSLDVGDRERVIKALFAHWAELAPEAAANAALAAKVERIAAFQVIVAEWAARDPAALWAWAQAHQNPDLPLSNVAEAIAAHDAPKAWEWINALDPSARRSVDLYGLFEQWARHDGAEALRVALAVRNDRSEVVTAAIAGWGESNPHAAIAAAQQIKDRESRTETLEKLFRNWSERDPRAAMEALLTQPNNVRSQVIDNVIRSLGERDPDALAKLVERLQPGWEKQYAVMSMAERLAPIDPPAAFNMMLSLTNDENRRRALTNLAHLSDPSRLSELRALASKLPVREDREAVEEGIVRVWAQFDPMAAATWAMRAEWPATQRRYLDRIMEEWNDPSAALRWTQAIPKEDDRETALGCFVSRLARDEPHLAASYLDQLSGREWRSCVSQITEEWTKTDPDAAAAWAMTLPEDESRERAFTKIVDAKMNYGIADVAAWLETLPPGGSRDAAVEQFSSLTRSIDPVGSLSWALTIAERGKRESAIEWAVQAWRGTDAEAALRWIESTDTLSPERKKHLLE